MNTKEIIKKHAKVSTINKGKTIFYGGGVRQLISMNNHHYSAEVAGSGRKSYQLHFSVSDQDQLTSYCSCPYDWGGICKHMVAALLYLNEHGGHQQPSVGKIKDNKRITSTPYRVSIADMTHLKNLAEDAIYLQARTKTPSIDNISIDEDKIIIEVPSEYYYDGPTIVHIHPHNDRLLISSDPPQKVEGLSVYELAALIFIQESDMTHLFDLFDEQKLDEMLLQKAKQYGIEDIAAAREYFEVGLNRSGEVLHLKKKHQNLLPLSAYRSDYLNFAKNITGGESTREEILLAGGKKLNEKNPMVVRFALQADTVFNDHTVITLLPFVCKVKPDGTFYKTNLQPLSNLGSWASARPSLTDQDRELVSFSEKFGGNALSDGLRTAYHKLNEEQQQLFVLEQNLKTLQDLLPILHKQEDTFLIEQGGDYHYRYGMQPGDFQPITISDEVPQPILEIDIREGFVQITPQLKFSTGTYKWNSNKIKFFNKILGTIDHKVFLMGSVESAIVIHYTFSKSPNFKVTEKDFHGVFNDIIRPLSKYMTVNFKRLPAEIREEVNMSTVTSKKVYLKELNQFILIKPIVEYGFEAINILADQPTIRLEGNTIMHLNRSAEDEHAFLDMILGCHPDFDKNHNQDFFHLHLDDFVRDYWFLTFLEKLKNEGIEVFGFNEFKNFQYSPYRPSINVKVSSGEDWFDVDIEVLVGDTRIALKDLKKALVSNDKYIKLGDGKLAVLPVEWVEKLQRYLRIGTIEKGELKISKLKFNAIDELFDGIDNEQVLNEIAEKRRKLLEFNHIAKIPLPKVNATLRDYQKEGYRWLHFLHQFGWGGILADDMGLGKTLQIITFLRFLKSNKIKNNLVVVPTTLLFNWKVEIEKFCPSLRFHIHHGNDRDKQKIDWKKYDIVITTYGLIASDIKLFSSQKYGYVILDESQAIKNPASKRFKAVNVLKAHNRLALTGTPIENGTFDLYAQMSFVNPGMFVSAEGFRKEYAIPIDKNGDQQAAIELHRIIHPFVLRRTKEMVATELPPKIEDVIYCNMGVAQRKVYDAYRNEYRNNILNLIEEDGLEKSKLHVLQALMKLRQVCNSPALLSGEESYDNESVKIKELLRHIQEKTGDHKLLIFSQFVKMLQLIKTELEKLDINFSYLDGQTTQKNRKQAVDDFQENKNIRVFLISLKAGGTGINLTAADYVYIVDPWWNPAVENQAIDRCYRIGQDKKVIAYRMICKETIEEKIMNYKGRKQAVADSIIQTDENMMKKISKDDIMDLFG